MSTTRDLTKLFESIASHDFVAAQAAAATIIEAEGKKGHTSAARSLRAALSGSAIRGHRLPEPITGTIRSDSFVASALARQTVRTPLSEVMLRPEVRTTVESVIKEFRHKDILRSKGIRRRSKLMLVGPPGCGKSLTAQAIASELDLPFYIVRFDAVIAAYLGQTASRLRELFDFASKTSCVVLFDEIDALGKQRGGSQDVGELDRIVIAMMQELEFFNSPGILIATSNLPKSLDTALWRRFDESIIFRPPSRPEIQTFARRLAQRYKLNLSKGMKASLLELKSFADIENMVEGFARKAALAELSTNATDN